MLCEEHEGLQQQLERALMAAGGMACKDSCHAEAAKERSVSARLTEAVYISAGVTSNTADDEFGARVGVGFGF